MAKTNYKKLLDEILEFSGKGNLEGVERECALKYVEAHWDSCYNDKDSAKEVGLSRREYAMGAIGNGLLDGLHMEYVDVVDLGNGQTLIKDKEQEIEEVDQESLKKALKSLLTKENGFLGMLYEKWEEYNKEYFFGELSYPLITFDKLSNRTLGNYTHGEDAMGITNHIRFNRNFIALNTEERILETLRHEMIHQWQDEILYYGDEQKTAKDIKVKMVDENGEVVTIETRQKKRPKDWHNRDFKDFAKVVAIPAIGDKCYGNPAKMPEAQSYNRKFQCACIASNGYPMTVWSTRKVSAVCMVCEKKYVEIPKGKGSKIIKVEQSHVEKSGEDAVAKAHKEKYAYFERFTSKELKDAFLESFEEQHGYPITEIAEGVYQKEHNGRKEGFTHWVAYNTAEVIPDVVRNDEVEHIVATEPEEPKAPKAKKEKAPKEKKEPKAKKEPKTKKAKPAEEPQVELPKEDPKPTAKILPPEEPKERSYKNAKDLLDLYKELGSIKAVADYFGKTSGTIIYQAKQLGVDFKKGTVVVHA